MVTKLSFTSRLFVWSIIFEPLLLFVFADRSRFGATFAFGRVLQVLVLGILVLRLPLLLMHYRTSAFRTTAPPSFLWSKYALFFALAVLAGLLGLRAGAYAVPITLEFNATESRLAQQVNAVDFRPLVEYVIAIFSFFYFVLLPRVILNTREHLDYFFRVFRKVLIWCLVVGFADILAIKWFGFFGLPRHLGDGVLIGPRFHGLAGEPRHAFAYLFFALAVMHAEAHFHDRRISRPLIFAILAAAVATNSGSGLVGIACFGGLYALNTLLTLRWRDMLRVVLLVILIPGVVYLASRSSTRISLYLESATQIWDALEAGRPLPGLLAFQEPEIYPLYDLAKKAQSYQLIPVLLGSGLGAASAVNNRLAVSGIEGLANPNSQLVRSLYESGVIGSLVFVLAFLSPVKRWTRKFPWARQRAFVAFMLLVLGCAFGVRGNTAFIYLGIMAAMFELLPGDRTETSA